MGGRRQFEAIGTRWTITATGRVDWPAIHARIDEFDRCYSRFRGDSLVARMARRAGRYDLPPDGYRLLQFYEQLYRATDGLVTPLIGQTMVNAGYDAEYSFKSKAPATPPAWDKVISYDQDSITLAQPALLDFGAAGKGYLVDILAALLGDGDFTIDAGGDIRHSGKPITVGLENPRDASEAIGIVKLANQSLCASSGNRRAWGGYHHIINPETVESPRDILATWVLADDCLTADGLATALFFVPAAKLQKFTFGYAVLRDDMSLEQANMNANIFTAA
jgi:thiamine biosynthesis lipoprotein